MEIFVFFINRWDGGSHKLCRILSSINLKFSLYCAALTYIYIWKFPSIRAVHPSSLPSLVLFYLLNKYSVGSRSPLDWQPLWTPQKSLFLSHSGPYWLSYLSISGPAEPLHFLACSLSLHLRLFASLSPLSACVCPHLSPPLFFLYKKRLVLLPFPTFLSRPKHIFAQNYLAAELWGLMGKTYFPQLISLLLCWPAFASFFFCLPLFVFFVGPQQHYLCFTHLSPHYLLCHGTVNVSDRDRSRWKSTPSFVSCLFCYPSLTLFLFISGRRAGPSLYLVAKFTHWKGRKASNKQLRYS